MAIIWCVLPYMYVYQNCQGITIYICLASVLKVSSCIVALNHYATRNIPWEREREFTVLLINLIILLYCLKQREHS